MDTYIQNHHFGKLVTFVVLLTTFVTSLVSLTELFNEYDWLKIKLGGGDREVIACWQHWHGCTSAAPSPPGLARNNDGLHIFFIALIDHRMLYWYSCIVPRVNVEKSMCSCGIICCMSERYGTENAEMQQRNNHPWGTQAGRVPLC